MKKNLDRSDKIIQPKPEAPTGASMPELVDEIEKLDNIMSEWGAHHEQFDTELLQYKDIDSAYLHLDVLMDMINSVYAMVRPVKHKGKKKHEIKPEWRNAVAFLRTRYALRNQLRELTTAKNNLELKTVMKLLKRAEKSIGTFRNNLNVVMVEGIGDGKSQKLIEDIGQLVDKVEEQVRESVLDDEPMGGQVYTDSPAPEEEEEDYSEEQVDDVRPYYEVIQEFDEAESSIGPNRETAAIDLSPYPSLIEGGWTEIAIDVARYGEDRTCIAVSQGPHLVDLSAFPKIDTMETTGRLVIEIKKWKPKTVKIETTGGLGAAVFDRLREMSEITRMTRLVALEVQGAPSPRGEKLNAANLRAELYLNLEERLRTGTFTLSPDEELGDDIANIRYKILSNGKIQILDKLQIKKNLGRSPDKADAVAMVAWMAPSPQIFV